MIEKLTEQQAEENAALIRERWGKAGIRTDWPDYYEVRELIDADIDYAVTTVSHYPNTVTLDEILDTEGLVFKAGGCYNQKIRAITVVYSVWVDKEAVAARKDNILAEWERNENPSHEDRFRYSILRRLKDHGLVVAYIPTHFNWIDWAELNKAVKGSPTPLLAVFNIREEEWEVDAPDGSHTTIMKKGFCGTAMFADGVFRRLRFEGGVYESVVDGVPVKLLMP